MKAKTVEQHKLDGTFREDRHGGRVVASGAPQKPAGLSPEADQLWESAVGLGSCGATDETFLLATIDWFELWRSLAARLRADPSDYKALVSASAAWKALSGCLGKLGLSPIDRQRLEVEPESPQGISSFARRRRPDPLDEYQL